MDPVAATYNIDGLKEYIENQGNQVVKRVCSKFPFRSKIKDDPSLLNDASSISQAMKSLL